MNTPTQNQFTNSELEQIEELQHRIFTCFGNISYKDSAVVAEVLYKEGWRKQSDVIDEFVERLKEAPIKCALPLLGLTTRGEMEEYFDDIMLQVRDAIIGIAKEMKGGE